MSTLDTSYVDSSAHVQTAPALPLLGQVPNLLEYRSESDPDGEFILKTVVGFTAGLLAMFLCLDIGYRLIFNHTIPMADQLTELLRNFAAMVGIAAVASSLLLVGLKVRADHSDDPLFARHWLNSISTGALYSLMIWLPLQLQTHSFPINRFVMSGIFMLLLSFPAIAAKWVIAPHPSYAKPATPSA